MNKQEMTIVGLLVAALIAWGLFSKPTAPAGGPAAGAGGGAVTNATALTPAAAPGAGAAETLLAAAPPATTGTVALVPATPVARGPATYVTLSNALTRLRVSSHGAAVMDVELPEYRALLAKQSGPVTFDFAAQPALALSGLPGAGVDGEFTLAADASGTGLTARAELPGGLAVERRLELRDAYHLVLTETLINRGGEAITVPAHGLSVGPMQTNAGESVMPGMVFLGVDTEAAASQGKVKHWGKAFNEIFGLRGGFGCSPGSAAHLPEIVNRGTDGPTAWVAAKNKYFVQLLTPEAAATNCRVHVARDPQSKGLLVRAVWAELEFGAQALAPGQQVERRVQYYVGPKSYERLKALGAAAGEIMQFGWWGWFRWICAALLQTLNLLHAAIPNYGVAVILVTVVVRALFWPITHKATMSMRKMQRVQPLMTAVREKYKDNPQKMNQEVMALYREHRVNPMSGCLPMLVQIPVFIALYVMLRSAIELRFAEFLWIRDLSEPENLFAGVLPIPLNILPLLMTATTVLQQKLTPATGDPQQQKIMMWMPVIFLFMFYSMPSALVLYWTVSQTLAIVQLLWTQKRWPPEAPLPVPAKLQPKKK